MTRNTPEGAAGGFALVRVDDRLLHGQVIFGWGQELAPHEYVIVDDEVAEDPWEREAFLSAAPPDVTVDAQSVVLFLARWRDWPDPSRTVILLRDVGTLLALADGGFQAAGGINLGGLHGRADTSEYAPSLHLSAADRDVLLGLLDRGALLFAQDLPSSPRVEGEALRHMLQA